VWPLAQVNVGEDEPEDIAVRRFMKKVMESGVIDEVRKKAGPEKRAATGCSKQTVALPKPRHHPPCFTSCCPHS